MSLKRKLGEIKPKRNCRYEVIKGVVTPSLVIHFLHYSPSSHPRLAVPGNSNCWVSRLLFPSPLVVSTCISQALLPKWVTHNPCLCGYLHLYALIAFFKNLIYWVWPTRTPSLLLRSSCQAPAHQFLVLGPPEIRRLVSLNGRHFCKV